MAHNDSNEGFSKDESDTAGNHKKLLKRVGASVSRLIDQQNRLRPPRLQLLVDTEDFFQTCLSYPNALVFESCHCRQGSASGQNLSGPSLQAEIISEDSKDQSVLFSDGENRMVNCSGNIQSIKAAIFHTQR